MWSNLIAEIEIRLCLGGFIHFSPIKEQRQFFGQLWAGWARTYELIAYLFPTIEAFSLSFLIALKICRCCDPYLLGLLNLLCAHPHTRPLLVNASCLSLSFSALFNWSSPCLLGSSSLLFSIRSLTHSHLARSGYQGHSMNMPNFSPPAFYFKGNRSHIGFTS